MKVSVRVAKGTAEDGENGDTATAGDGTGVAAFSSVESSAITYVMTPRLVQKFVPPSPQYLTAVYRTLTSSFPEFSDRPIEICDYTGERRRSGGGSTGEPINIYIHKGSRRVEYKGGGHAMERPARPVRYLSDGIRANRARDRHC